MMNWLVLVIAGFFEIAWAVGLKYTQGFTKLIPSVFTGCSMAISFILLSYALRTIPVGTGYAVWTGIGACGTLIFGMVFLGESRDFIPKQPEESVFGCVSFAAYFWSSLRSLPPAMSLAPDTKICAASLPNSRPFKLFRYIRVGCILAIIACIIILKITHK